MSDASTFCTFSGHLGGPAAGSRRSSPGDGLRRRGPRGKGWQTTWACRVKRLSITTVRFKREAEWRSATRRTHTGRCCTRRGSWTSSCASSTPARSRGTCRSAFEGRTYQVTGPRQGLPGARRGSVTVLRGGRELPVRLLGDGKDPSPVEDGKSVRSRVDRAKAEQRSRPDWKPARRTTPGVVRSSRSRTGWPPADAAPSRAAPNRRRGCTEDSSP